MLNTKYSITAYATVFWFTFNVYLVPNDISFLSYRLRDFLFVFVMGTVEADRRLFSVCVCR